MANERVYISSQLACLLHPMVLKVLFYLVSWQSKPEFKYYPKQMSKMLHMTVEDIELSIQSLIDKNLITATNIDGGWVLSLEKDQINRYMKAPLDKVSETVVFPVASKVSWNVQKTQEKASESVLEGLSDDALERLIIELQKRKEKRKGCEIIYANANNEIDQLPF